MALTITSNEGCTAIVDSTAYVIVHDKPIANFISSPNSVSSFSPLVSFIDLSTPTIVNWNWNFGDLPTTSDISGIQNPIYQYPPTAGTYYVTLIVSNQYGCVDTVIQHVEITDDLVFYTPNAFTPNGDQVNDVFLPQGVGFDTNTFSMMIFDRFGNMIYATNDYQKGWDGRANQGSEIAQADVYVWKIELKDNLYNKEHHYIGRVNIIK